MLFGIICLLAVCSDVRAPKHTHAEDYCADSETARLFRRSIWTGLDNDLKIILMLDGQDFEIYGAFDEDKDGIHEYAEYYIGTLRIYNDTIIMTEKESSDSVTAILKEKFILFLETDSTEILKKDIERNSVYLRVTTVYTMILMNAFLTKRCK